MDQQSPIVIQWGKKLVSIHDSQAMMETCIVHSFQEVLFCQVHPEFLALQIDQVDPTLHSIGIDACFPCMVVKFHTSFPGGPNLPVSPGMPGAPVAPGSPWKLIIHS